MPAATATTNRTNQETPDAAPTTPRAEELDPARAELAGLRQRIRAGLNLVGEDPKPKDAPACKECFQRGWLSAMKSLMKE